MSVVTKTKIVFGVFFLILIFIVPSYWKKSSSNLSGFLGNSTLRNKQIEILEAGEKYNGIIVFKVIFTDTFTKNDFGKISFHMVKDEKKKSRILENAEAFFPDLDFRSSEVKIIEGVGDTEMWIEGVETNELVVFFGSHLSS